MKCPPYHLLEVRLGCFLRSAPLPAPFLCLVTCYWVWEEFDERSLGSR